MSPAKKGGGRIARDSLEDGEPGQPQDYPAPKYDEPAVLVDSSSAVEDLAARLKRATRIGVDIEADSLYHYFEKVCLIQITAHGVDYIVDPLSGAKLEPLEEVFANPSIEKIFHGADGDMALLRHSLGIETVGIFDTMVAAQVAGLRRFGLGDLIRLFFEYGVDKRYQRHNWSLRPLAPDPIHYARTDTHFLLDLRERLWERIRDLGRAEQAREEIALVEERRIEPKPFTPDGVLKLNGAHLLDDSTLRILTELYITRDEIARRKDLPVFRIIPNDLLLFLARHAPSHRQALNNLRGISPRIARSYGNEIIAAVRRGRASTEEPPRRKAPGPRVESPPEMEVRYQALKRWRNQKTRELQLVPAMVASNEILKAVARSGPRSLEQLREIPHVRNWQVNDFGEEWLKMLKLG